MIDIGSSTLSFDKDYDVSKDEFARISGSDGSKSTSEKIIISSKLPYGVSIWRDYWSN